MVCRFRGDRSLCHSPREMCSVTFKRDGVLRYSYLLQTTCVTQSRDCAPTRFRICYLFYKIFIVKLLRLLTCSTLSVNIFSETFKTAPYRATRQGCLVLLLYWLVSVSRKVQYCTCKSIIVSSAPQSGSMYSPTSV